MKLIFWVLLTVNVLLFVWDNHGGLNSGKSQALDLPLPKNEERIVLIRELPEIPRKTPDPKSPTVRPERKLVETLPTPTLHKLSSYDPNCMLLGPFEHEEEARGMLAKVRSLDADAELRKLAGTRVDSYWLLYPKAENIFAARANRQMLQEKGVRDVWLLSGGELDGALSLGLFPQREQAAQLQERLRTQGIETQIQPRRVGGETYWLKLDKGVDSSQLNHQMSGWFAEHSEPLRQEACR